MSLLETDLFAATGCSRHFKLFQLRDDYGFAPDIAGSAVSGSRESGPKSLLLETSLPVEDDGERVRSSGAEAPPEPICRTRPSRPIDARLPVPRGPRGRRAPRRSSREGRSAALHVQAGRRRCSGSYSYASAYTPSRVPGVRATLSRDYGGEGNLGP